MKIFLLFFFLMVLISIKSLFGQTPVFFGMSSVGGKFNKGVIFRINADGTNLDSLFSFSDSSGRYPFCNLTPDNGDTLFYGITQYGGAFGNGTIFSFNPYDSSFKKIVDLTDTIGTYANTTLILIGNKFYGTASQGGKYGLGTVFSYDMAMHKSKDLFDFNTGHGYQPSSGLLKVNNNKFYGETYYGPAGSLFTCDTLGNCNDFYKFGSYGDYPLGGLMRAKNGTFYGIGSGGGKYSINDPYGDGVIFSYDSATNTYADLHDFNDTMGSFPACTLLEAKDGKLYGVTQSGGQIVNISGDHYGILFSYDPITKIFKDIHDFDGTDGSGPSPGPLLQASDGNIYGTTGGGGAYSYGTFFRFNPDSNTFTKLLDFDGKEGSGVSGGLLELNPKLKSGIALVKKNTILIYPNPASTQLTISANQPVEKIEIKNIFGQTVISNSQPNSNSNLIIDVSKLPSALYLINIQTENGHIIEKFVKE